MIDSEQCSNGWSMTTAALHRAPGWGGVACRLIDAGQNQGTLEGLSDWFVGVLYYSGEIGSFPSAI